MNWYKRTIDLFFLMIIFDGAIRKWIFPGWSIPLQVLRDILPLIALLQYILFGNRIRIFRGLSSYLSILLLLYFTVSLVQMFNPKLPSFLIALLGIRTHFAYAPVIILLPSYFGSWRYFVRKLSAICFLSIPICLLAVYQTNQPYDSVFNLYASGESSHANFGSIGLVRASGTFSYITGMSIFAQLITLVSVFLISLPKISKKLKLLALCSLIGGLSACIATGSRAPIYTAVFQIILFIVIQARVIFLSRSFFRIGLAIVVCIPLIFYSSNVLVVSFFQRVNSVSGDFKGRIYQIFFEWIDILSEYPLGTGLGSGHQQAMTLIGGAPGFTIAEAELSRIAYELGYIGFFIFMLFRLSILRTIWHKLHQCTDSLLRKVYSLTIVLLLPACVGYVYTPVANALYWSAIGIAIWAYQQQQLVLVQSSTVKINEIKA